MFFFVLFSLFLSQSKISPFYGVPTEKLELYEGSGNSWSCLISGDKIPYNYINDYFCDCPDGTDEPGTPACSSTNMTFNCKNSGFIEKNIPTGYLNDGLCDCCDGSDEYGDMRSIICQDSCSQLKSEYVVNLKDEVEKRNIGYRMRLEYISRFENSEINNPERMEELLRKLEQLKQNVTLYKTCLNLINSTDDGVLEPVGCDHVLPVDYEVHDVEDHEDGSPKGHSLEENDEWYSEDGKHHVREKPSSPGQQNPICSALGSNNDVFEEPMQYDSTGFSAFLEDYVEKDHVPYVADLTDFIYDGVSGEISSEEINVKYEQWYQLNCGPQSSESSDLENYTKLERRITYKKLLSFTKAEMTKIDRKIKNVELAGYLDFGDGAFFELLGSCYKYVTSFEYEFCPFRYVRQIDLNTRNSVNLGIWAGWEERSGGRVMMYSNGDPCGEGPLRSTRIEFICGFEDEIKHVEEPEICAYVIKMKTPAVCPQVVFEEEVEKKFGSKFISDEL